MAGRGGRGQALLEALKSLKQEAPGAASAEPAPTVVALPRGRASLFQSLAGGAKSLPSVQPTCPGNDSASAAPPISIGRGRAALLGLAAQSKPVTPSSTESSKAASEVSAKLEELSIADKPPVNRMGESGKRISATANFVRLECEPGKGFFEYEVKFIPENDSRNMCFKLLNSVSASFGSIKNFDGTILYLPIKLPEQTTILKTKHPVDQTEVTIKIIFKKIRKMSECVHFYNVLFNKIFKILNFVRMGRQHYNPMASSAIPQHKLEIWPGYVTAIDEYEGGLMLNINASHRVLRQKTCYEVIQDASRASDWQSACSKELIGACVLTRYNNQMYRVDDIDFSSTPMTSFENRGGGKTTFVEYYLKQYEINIRDKKQPLLISRSKQKVGPKRGEEVQDTMICLIPELCHMTGLTDSMRADFKLMKDIATYTRITPNQRQLSLRKFLKSVTDSPEASKVLLDWGLKLDTQTVRFDARVVPTEQILFGHGRSTMVNAQADWSREACNNPVLTAVDIKHWIVIATDRDARVAEDFIGCLIKVGNQMGIEINKPDLLTLRTDKTEGYIKLMRENIKSPLQLVVTICPTSRDDRYSAIKKIACADQPIASQVINTRTIGKPDKLRSVTQKIALQINCKLGGSLWAVKVPFDDLMVVGMDVYHEANRKGNSVTGFVASLNQTLSRWHSKVIFQAPGQELVDGLKSCFISALKKYYDVNGKFPSKIVLFRDGVGDGQLKFAAEWEIPQLISCFATVNPQYSPKLTVVIVQKRINARIFAELNSSYENPPPGTVVDHTITRRNWYDFFLVSQFSRQGTVTPTHYVVVYDGIQMKVDHIQRLSYKLTHMYYNWPGTIRVPAPCQYAHKLAKLVGLSIHREPSEKLSDRLFFL